MRPLKAPRRPNRARVNDDLFAESVGFLPALRAPGVQALSSKSQEAEGAEKRVRLGRLKRMLLPHRDSVAHIAPGVIFNTSMDATVAIVSRLYSRPAVLRAVTGIEAETNKTSVRPKIGCEIAIRPIAD